MFMQIIPCWIVEFTWNNAVVSLRVRDDDLAAFENVLRFNNVQLWTVAKENLYGPVSDDEIE